jgi:hypothetical protein
MAPMVCIIDKRTTSYGMQVRWWLISKLEEKVTNINTMHASQIFKILCMR